jgi:hypothetical protein
LDRHGLQAPRGGVHGPSGRRSGRPAPATNSRGLRACCGRQAPSAKQVARGMCCTKHRQRLCVVPKLATCRAPRQPQPQARTHRSPWPLLSPPAQEQSPAPKKKRKKRQSSQRSRIKTRINAAAAPTEIRGMCMGGAHHEVGSLSRKRYTQCVGQQPKGHWGNSENTGGRDPHGRRQGRECACTNGAAGKDRRNWLEELKKTPTREVRGNSRAD